MGSLEAQIYYGCRRCDGLFDKELCYNQHVVVCTGDRQMSDCQWFACPKDLFLKLNEPRGQILRSDFSNGNGDDQTCRLGQLPLQLPKQCLSSPLRKIRVIGILKKTITQHVPSSSRGVLRRNKLHDFTKGSQGMTLHTTEQQTSHKSSDNKCSNLPSVPDNIYSIREEAKELKNPDVKKSQNNPVLEELQNSELEELKNPEKLKVPNLEEQKHSSFQNNNLDHKILQSLKVKKLKNSTFEEQKHPDLEELMIPSHDELRNTDVENFGNSDFEVLQNQEVEELKNPGFKKLKSPDLNELKNPGFEELKNPHLEEIKNAGIEETADNSSQESSDLGVNVIFRVEPYQQQSDFEGLMQLNVGTDGKGELLQCDFATRWTGGVGVDSAKREQPKFLCDSCPRQFKNRSSLTRHCAKKHNGKSNFLCKYSPDCNFVAVNSASLRDHMRKHTGELLFCNYNNCKFMTKFEKALSLHKAKHQGITRFICEVCGYKTIEAGSFKRHSMTHTGKKLYKCPDCSYKATSRHVVVKHIYGKHINHKRYACNRCKFTTAYYSGLSMHLMAHEGIRPYKCSACSYRSNLSNKVKRHCSQKHKDTAEQVVKVEDCFKFDVRDYLNPEVEKVDVKVIRLMENGEEEEEQDIDPEDGMTRVPPVLDPDMSVDDRLLCDANISTLPSEGTESPETMSIIDGGFNLCDESTFPLDSVSQSFQSDDSNSVFVTRPDIVDVDLGKVMNAEKTNLNSPLRRSGQNNSNIFANMGLSNFVLQPESSESLNEINSLNTPSKISEILKTGSSSSGDFDQDDSSQNPLQASACPFYHVITVPLLAVPSLLTVGAQQNQSKPLKSLLSPCLLKSQPEQVLAQGSDHLPLTAAQGSHEIPLTAAQDNHQIPLTAAQGNHQIQLTAAQGSHQIPLTAAQGSDQTMEKTILLTVPSMSSMTEVSASNISDV